jgi:hypothetical protein
MGGGGGGFNAWRELWVGERVVTTESQSHRVTEGTETHRDGDVCDGAGIGGGEVGVWVGILIDGGGEGEENWGVRLGLARGCCLARVEGK